MDVGVAAEWRVHLQRPLPPPDMRWTYRRQQVLQPGIGDRACARGAVGPELSFDLCPVGLDRDLVECGDGVGKGAARGRVGVDKRLRPRGQMMALVVPLE